MTPHDNHIHPPESNWATPGLTYAQMLTSFGWRIRVELWKSDGCVMAYFMALEFLFELWNFRDFIRSFEASTGCPEGWPSLDKRGGPVGRGPETVVVCHWPWPCYHHTHIFPRQANFLWQIRSCYSFVGEWFPEGCIWTCASTFCWTTQQWPKQITLKRSLVPEAAKTVCVYRIEVPYIPPPKKSNIHEPRQTSKTYPHASAGHRKNLRWALMCHCASNGVFLWRSP